MMHIVSKVVFTALVLNLNYVRADSILTCPASIQTKQELQSPMDGWQTSNNRQSHGFSRMGFRMKNDIGELRSDSEKKRKDLTVLRWEFGANDEIEQFCEYFGTSIRLTKRINANSKSCEIIQKSSNNIFVSASCKD